ncbi:MAG: tRNA (adenosine(37)-N6)-threonylcarbamoyltransferase complex dimerization subunit type 1 TsaB [Tannerellaceae bacterium]|jgi:tRNA threonylcarbamoyladenosine biosynthesis protein TsaB|nr:tRNA (adenosine(37)-N6)-threonylcarbamoyltransferase complex dimerization subunit type 1 TsaB [Tannerellaceae bacterium]
MPCILHIETSTSACSVALSAAGELLFDKVSLSEQSHSTSAGVFVQSALSANASFRPDAIAVSIGPGSYTGLRIGLSLAKGLTFGYNIPLIAVPTLAILASRAIKQVGGDEASLYCPMLDARRMEVYAAVYDSHLAERREVRADILGAETYLPYLDTRLYIFGNGSLKYKSILPHPNAIFLDVLYPVASDMISLAEASYANKTFIDPAYSEPFYLKDFQATVPKNKI